MDAITAKEPTLIGLTDIEEDALIKQIAKNIALKT
jgi:hypothetical protein